LTSRSPIATTAFGAAGICKDEVCGACFRIERALRRDVDAAGAGAERRAGWWSRVARVVVGALIESRRSGGVRSGGRMPIQSIAGTTSTFFSNPNARDRSTWHRVCVAPTAIASPSQAYHPHLAFR